MWHIAGANQQTGERLTFMVTHMPRDMVFKVQTRLQLFFDFARQLLSGLEDQAEVFAKIDDLEDDVLSDEQIQDRIALLKELELRILANSPQWSWEDISF